jgi:hypothetical protein
MSDKYPRLRIGARGGEPWRSEGWKLRFLPTPLKGNEGEMQGFTCNDDSLLDCRLGLDHTLLWKHLTVVVLKPWQVAQRRLPGFRLGRQMACVIIIRSYNCSSK